MIKSIYVGLNLAQKNYKDLGRIGANHLIVAGHFLNDKKWNWLRELDMTLGISVDCFGKDGCPANPKALEKLKRKIQVAFKRKPEEIWLDHFRFDGKWEAVRAGRDKKVYVYRSAHTPCKWCTGKKRNEVVANAVRRIKRLIPKSIKVGYFAVPLEIGEHTRLASELGQDHAALGRIFDMASPMLYHRMIKKPASYISEYVKYLYRLTGKDILPIIQIKDMPDYLPDKLTKKEFFEAAKEAIKPPSRGVSVFVWEHAVEKNKVRLIKSLFIT